MKASNKLILISREKINSDNPTPLMTVRNNILGKTYNVEIEATTRIVKILIRS